MSSTAGAEARRARRKQAQGMTSHALALAAARETLKIKAQDVVILDLTSMTGVCDYFVICSASSETQVKAIANQVSDGLLELGHKVWHTEGLSAMRWVLLDFVDVVVHVFHQETREIYQLEKLWADAGRESCADD